MGAESRCVAEGQDNVRWLVGERVPNRLAENETRRVQRIKKRRWRKVDGPQLSATSTPAPDAHSAISAVRGRPVAPAMVTGYLGCPALQRQST